MEPILFNEVPIDSLKVWNTPSYVQQNVYGNMKYYPVLEPVDSIEMKDITDAHIERAKQYKSTDEVVAAFFNWNPRTTGGKLSDSKNINFLGFRYVYHPNHKTYYGNVDEEYLILPAIARWMMCINASTDDDDFDDAHRFPRGYKGGCSRGYKIYLEGSEKSKETKVDKSFDGKVLIPMIPTGSHWRAVAAMSIPMCGFTNMDACFMSLGIDPKSTLTGSDVTDIIQVMDDKVYVATIDIDLSTVDSHVAFKKVAESGDVTLFVTEPDKAEINDLCETLVGLTK